MTGPRHGYSITLSSVQNGLEINTAFLDHLSVDPDANTLTAGGSVTFGQAIDALYPAGKQMRKLLNITIYVNMKADENSNGLLLMRWSTGRKSRRWRRTAIRPTRFSPGQSPLRKTDAPQYDYYHRFQDRE